MYRLALLIIGVACVAALSVFLVRQMTHMVEQQGGFRSVTTGGMMQKIAFFMLLCLIVYVSISGAS